MTYFLECYLIDAIEDCEVENLLTINLLKVNATEVNLFAFHGQIMNIIYENIIQTMCFDEESAYNEVLNTENYFRCSKNHRICSKS